MFALENARWILKTLYRKALVQSREWVLSYKYRTNIERYILASCRFPLPTPRN